MNVILKNVSLAGGEPQDLGIADGRITSDVNGQEVDCSGLIALPGLVDLHTHLREPGGSGAETVESGTTAAARGGYTAVCAMANTSPVADSIEVVEEVVRLAAKVARCDVFPVGAVSVGLEGRRLADIPGMAGSAAAVTMFSDDGHCVDRSDLMREALLAVREVGGVLAQHAQDPLLTRDAQLHDGEVARSIGLPGWPSAAEETVIARDCLLAHHLGARLHVCHVSTKGSVDVIRWAKQQGWPVTAEVTPHHLILTDETARTCDPKYKVNPPLRTTADVEALRAGLVDGTIDAVATDHAPHLPGEKAKSWCEAPMGMLGLETALPVVADIFVSTGLLTWAEVADRMSITPAVIAGRNSDHGLPLAPGSVATLCLVDPAHSWSVKADELASLSSNSPFDGHAFNTRIVATLLRGVVTHDLNDLFRSCS